MIDTPEKRKQLFTMPAPAVLNRVGYAVCGLVCYLTPGTTTPVFAGGALCFFTTCLFSALLKPDPLKPAMEAFGPSTGKE